MAALVWICPAEAMSVDRQYADRISNGLWTLLDGEGDKQMRGGFQIAEPVGMSLSVLNDLRIHAYDDSISSGRVCLLNDLLAHWNNSNLVPRTSGCVFGISDYRMPIFKAPKGDLKGAVFLQLESGKREVVNHGPLERTDHCLHEYIKCSGDTLSRHVRCSDDAPDIVTSDRVSRDPRHGPVERADFENFANLLITPVDLTVSSHNNFGGVSEDDDGCGSSVRSTKGGESDSGNKILHIRFTVAPDDGTHFYSEDGVTTLDITDEDVDVSS